MAEQLADADVDIDPRDAADRRRRRRRSIVPADGGVFHVGAVAPAQAGLTQESLRCRPDRPARDRHSRFPYVIGVRLSNPFTYPPDRDRERRAR